MIFKKKMISCQRCPGAELVDNYETGDVVFPECGLVVLDRAIDVQWPVLDTNVQQCRASVTKIDGKRNGSKTPFACPRESMFTV